MFLQDQDMYSKYDQEEFEGIGDMEKTSHMKDPLIIHTVRMRLSPTKTCCKRFLNS